ncbi:hypothetical protein BDW71DRAFT_34346 [Aspergillus fruticulosus]
MQGRFEGHWAYFRLATHSPAPQGCRQPRCVPRAPILGVEFSQAGSGAPSAKAPALLLALRRIHSRCRQIIGDGGLVFAAGSLRDAFAKSLRSHVARLSRMRHRQRCSNSPRCLQTKGYQGLALLGSGIHGGVCISPLRCLCSCRHSRVQVK